MHNLFFSTLYKSSTHPEKMLRRIFFVLGISLLFTNCDNGLPISEEEKKEVISQLAEIKRLDQKFAGMPPSELQEEYGHEKAWEIFEMQRDSIGLINQRKIKELYKRYGYLGEVQIGEEVKAGDHYGIIRFGSRMDIYLPPKTNPLVVVGQRMVGGETVLADMKAREKQREGEVR